MMRSEIYPMLPSPALVWLVLVCVVVVALVWMFAGRGRRSLYVAKNLLTGNEREFFGRLLAAGAGEFHVFPQVCMGALMAPNVKPGGRSYMGIRATFSQKIVDFVICDRKLNVVALVELDDRTHSKEKDVARDRMTSSAGYQTLRYESRAKPSIEKIRQDIEACQKRKG